MGFRATGPMATSSRTKQEEPVLVAVDLGAESCRVSLLRWIEGQPEIQLVHRFANSARNEGNGLRWDIAAIYEGVEEGLRACARTCARRNRRDRGGRLGRGLCTPGAERRTGRQAFLLSRRTYREIAKPECTPGFRRTASTITGIQILALNTLYQLRADGDAEQNLPWINLPEFLLHRLGGRRVSEYTNATHTQLLGVRDEAWSPEIFESAGLDVSAAPPLVNPGTEIGQLRGNLASLPAFRNTRLIAPACHDTASAIAGIPAHGDDWAFISSGTWSLVGCVLDSACVSEAARQQKLQQRRRHWRQNLFPEKRKWHVAAAAMYRTLAIAGPGRGRLSNWWTPPQISVRPSSCSMSTTLLCCCRETCRRASMCN